jgi:hypothetical protein
MHTEPKNSNEIERRLSGRETEEADGKSADANQQVEDATSNAARVFIVCIIQVTMSSVFV